MAESLAPFLPTHHDIVTKMLEIGNVRRDDVVFDLGCGDGRILFAAVNDFRAKRAVGYELRRDLYNRVLQEINNRHLEGRIAVFNDDLINANIEEATVITLYLTTAGNKKLQSKLVKEAKPGTRIVSHSFDFAGWFYTRKEKVGWHTIYLYTTSDAFNNERKSRSLSPSSKKNLSSRENLYRAVYQTQWERNPFTKGETTIEEIDSKKIV